MKKASERWKKPQDKLFGCIGSKGSKRREMSHDPETLDNLLRVTQHEMREIRDVKGVGRLSEAIRSDYVGGKGTICSVQLYR